MENAALLLVSVVIQDFAGEDGFENLSLPAGSQELAVQVRSLITWGRQRIFREAEAVSFQEAQGNLKGDLSVTYLDVGQGNCALLEQNGHYMLIDGGDRETSSKVVSTLKSENVEKLDYLVVSHYDSDHLAGIIGVLQEFQVDTVLSPDYTTDTKLYQSYLAALEKANLQEIHPSQGESYSFGDSRFTVVGPVFYGHEDENDDSVGIRLQYGSVSFLFCGDAGEEAELEMVSSGMDLSSDVYLVDHHGSSSSTAEEFLRAVDPEYAVISCGKGNDYGHPTERVLKLLQQYEIELYRTDLQGTVQAVTDGTEVTWNVEACEDFTPGS